MSQMANDDIDDSAAPLIEHLAELRNRLIHSVVAFVVGMVMTPPDIFSQTMLAIPVWLLFEAGLYFSKLVRPRETEEEEPSEDLTDQQV